MTTRTKQIETDTDARIRNALKASGFSVRRGARFPLQIVATRYNTLRLRRLIEQLTIGDRLQLGAFTLDYIAPKKSSIVYYLLRHKGQIVGYIDVSGASGLYATQTALASLLNDFEVSYQDADLLTGCAVIPLVEKREMTRLFKPQHLNKSVS